MNLLVLIAIVQGEDELNISLEDLLKADQIGRWWIVGSAWEGRKDPLDSIKGIFCDVFLILNWFWDDSWYKNVYTIILKLCAMIYFLEAKSKTETSLSGTFSKQMMKLAKQQGMNTEIRRHIFCILGTSEVKETCS